MNRKSKSILTFIAVLMFIFTTMMATGMTAFAADENDLIWANGWEGQYSNFTVDTDNYYKNSRYSIKLTNDDYHSSYLTKIVAVEPFTTYRFSAMVKYSGYKLATNSEREVSGAYLSAKVPDTTDYKGNTSRFNGKKWSEQELTFTTSKDQTQVELMLWNGDQNGQCKGTAWFSDIKLEKAELTNQWNVLAIIYKNVDTQVKLDNQKVTIDHSLNKTDISRIKKELKNYDKWIDDNANGLMDLNDIDVVTVNEPVTKLVPFNINDDSDAPDYNGGYRLDNNADYVRDQVEKYSEKKKYHQIFVIVPLGGATQCWSGATGMYDDTTGFTQVLYDAESFNAEVFMGTYVHEMLHVVDNHSLKYDPETPLLHSYLNLDPEDVDTEKEKLAWYAKYMTATLPDGKGIDPRAYWQPSGKYTLITDDMTAGGLVDTSALPLDISGAKVSAIKNQTYTGKAIKPAVTITDGSYTLKKGVDYSVSYKNNKEAGTATATIHGKGIYTGTISTTFKIVKKGAATNAPTVKATTTVKLTWDKVDGAGKYEVWYSTNDGEMKKYKTLASGTTSCSVKISTKNTYMFAVRAYISSTGEYTDYGYIDV